MSVGELQLYLRDTGRDPGPIDGKWGSKTRAAVLRAMEDGPDTALTRKDFEASAQRLHVPLANIMAVAAVEAAGAGFFDRKPKILPEPHIFARLTGQRFNASHPQLSYSKWGARPYPRSQDGRYAQLLGMIELDARAGFSACSYGKFQICGFNHAACGYDSPWAFAINQAFDEVTQLKAFEKFLMTNGMLTFLRNSLWAKFAKAYNGPAYAKNRYDVRLAQAARAVELSTSRAA